MTGNACVFRRGDDGRSATVVPPSTGRACQDPRTRASTIPQHVPVHVEYRRWLASLNATAWLTSAAFRAFDEQPAGWAASVWWCVSYQIEEMWVGEELAAVRRHGRGVVAGEASWHGSLWWKRPEKETLAAPHDHPLTGPARLPVRPRLEKYGMNCRRVVSRSTGGIGAPLARPGMLRL
jgi:hypothetical protein